MRISVVDDNLFGIGEVDVIDFENNSLQPCREISASEQSLAYGHDERGSYMGEFLYISEFGGVVLDSCMFWSAFSGQAKAGEIMVYHRKYDGVDCGDDKETAIIYIKNMIAVGHEFFHHTPIFWHVLFDNGYIAGSGESAAPATRYRMALCISNHNPVQKSFWNACIKYAQRTTFVMPCGLFQEHVTTSRCAIVASIGVHTTKSGI